MVHGPSPDLAEGPDNQWLSPCLNEFPAELVSVELTAL